MELWPFPLQTFLSFLKFTKKRDRPKFMQNSILSTATVFHGASGFLSVSMWISSVFSGFIPPLKNSTSSTGVNARV